MKGILRTVGPVRQQVYVSGAIPLNEGGDGEVKRCGGHAWKTRKRAAGDGFQRKVKGSEEA